MSLVGLASGVFKMAMGLTRFLTLLRQTTLMPLYALTVARIHSQLNPVSQDHFRISRENLFGAKLDEIRPVGPKREEGLKTLQQQLSMVASLLDKNGSDSKFVMGESASFADFVLGGALTWARWCLAPEEWEELTKWNDGRWGKMFALLEQWGAVRGDQEAYSP
jgi:glutathione S-transferase